MFAILQMIYSNSGVQFTVDNKSKDNIGTQIMAWDEPLSEPMVAQFTDTYQCSN